MYINCQINFNKDDCLFGYGYSLVILALLSVPGMVAGLNLSITITAVFLLSACSFLILPWVRRPVRKWRLGLAFFLTISFLIVYIIGIISANLPSSLGDTQFNTWLYALLVLSVVVCLVVTVLNGDQNPLKTLIDSIFVSLLVICILQLGAWILGIEHAQALNMPQTRRYNSTLGAFDIHIFRVGFPISSGVQYSAIYPSLLLAVSLLNIRSGYRFVVSGVVALTMLILIDARGMTLAPILGWITFRLISRLPARTAALVAALIPLVPIVLYKARDWSQPLIALILPERNASSEMFTNRGYIWGEYFDHIAHADYSTVLFGYGGFGQYVSDINLRFSGLFTEFSDIGRILVHMHNSYAQIAVDFGLVGLAVVVAMIYHLFYRVFYADRLHGGAMIASLGTMMLSLQWAAGTEVILTPYSREGIIVAMLLWVSAAVLLPAPAPQGKRSFRRRRIGLGALLSPAR